MAGDRGEPDQGAEGLVEKAVSPVHRPGAADLVGREQLLQPRATAFTASSSADSSQSQASGAPSSHL